MDRIYLKRMAKKQIRGKIGILFLCELIVVAISMGCSTIPVAGGIASIILTPVLTFGLMLVYLNVSRGREADIRLLFEGFASDKFGKIWLTCFLIELYVLLWSMLLIIPGIVKAFSYMFAPYILADNPDFTPRQAIEKSKQITRGHKMDLFILGLSFIGWILLSIATFGIVTIYAGPYMETTLANAYNSLKGGFSVDTIYDDEPENPEKYNLDDK